MHSIVAHDGEFQQSSIVFLLIMSVVKYIEGSCVSIMDLAFLLSPGPYTPSPVLMELHMYGERERERV